MPQPVITLRDIRDLALRWTPSEARFGRFLGDELSWGSAHELGHALLSTPDERKVRVYGLCDAGGCIHADERCYIVELAAMRISAHLVSVAGAPALAEREVHDTDCYDEMATPENWRASWYLLRDARLWPLPRTRRGLERLLKKRLG